MHLLREGRLWEEGVSEVLWGRGRHFSYFLIDSHNGVAQHFHLTVKIIHFICLTFWFFPLPSRRLISYRRFGLNQK